MVATSIYLDTHHISRAADGLNRIPDLLGDKRYRFVFSASHVVESLPKGAAENHSAVKRLSLIVQPCNTSVVGWGNVSENELRYGCCHLEDIVCSQQDMLFPGFVFDRTTWTAKVRQGLKAVLLERVPDENFRRSILSKLIKRGRLTPEAIQLLRIRQDETSAQLQREMPQAVPLLNELYRFLEGSISDKLFLDRFKETLANPIALAHLSQNPELSSILEFSKFFWAYNDRLAKLLRELAVKLVKVQCSGIGLEYAQIRRNLVGHLNSAEFRSLVAKQFAGVEVSSERLCRMPGTKVFVDVFSLFVLEKMDRFANDRSADFGGALQLKRSDAADLSHLFYFPYVNLFGCDGAMRDRIRKAGWSTKNVFTTDVELERLLRADNEV
ncbi:hypothetical protein [Rhodopseudomonas palustris]|uniref:hypothetical protein n=1 Tax=Rhodopseudomonas palustris TaxID=1076 RepID=UPI0012EDA836|nr:hypothetical protein [Rhodopseudomonas palustris]